MMEALKTVKSITLEGKERPAPPELQDAFDRWEEKTNAFLEHARGVIHVGANVGQEKEIYAADDLPVIWIEPLSGVYDVLCERIRPYSKQFALQYLITDKLGASYKVGISNNGGQSSSIFDLKYHRDIWPEVHYVAAMDLESVTLQYVIERHHVDLLLYDTLIMDVQGAELLVLQGAGEYVKQFRWIRAECADYEMYEDACQLKDLDAYLIPRGFERVELWRALGKPEIGYCYEALYRRKDA